MFRRNMQSNSYCSRCKAIITPDSKESNENPDKITIKVKVAGEDYHDLLMDFSDGLDVGQQFFQQLASITGIPFNKIHSCINQYQHPYEEFYQVLNIERQDPSEYAELDTLKRFNNGDCYAVSMSFQDEEPPFRVNLWLNHRSSFDDDQCTPSYCQHINGRDFLNRRIEIIKYGEPKYRQLYTGNRISTIRSMGIEPYLRPICKLSLAAAVFRSYLHFSRTHG